MLGQEGETRAGSRRDPQECNAGSSEGGDGLSGHSQRPSEAEVMVE